LGIQDEDEAKFVARLVARDETAFNELVIGYERRVYALVYRMLGHRDEAEDLAQEVFVQIFKAIDQFRGESKLSTWIYRIALNLCKNRKKYLWYRRVHRQKSLDDVAELTSADAGKGVTVAAVGRPDQILEGLQLEQIVKSSIAKIEQDYREPMILRDVEDLSYEEISGVMGLPVGTIKSRVFRGRSQLREFVEEAMRGKSRSGKK